MNCLTILSKLFKAFGTLVSFGLNSEAYETSEIILKRTVISILHFELESVRNLCKSTLNALESLVDNIGVDHPFNNITQLMEDILGIDQK